ncbi:MAG: ATP-dependent Clp protease proteolytic subunit [Lachnospiraceae bacterium]|nr:ATP-dependent Clp protease proteolytic subunit [Lachnospiraceae bacterium]
MAIIEVKSSHGITTVPIESRLLNGRNVFFSGSVREETALDAVKEIMYLIAEDPHAPINLFITTNGGDVNQGMLLYDVMVGLKDIELRTICMGKAYSMGALLLAAGQKGRRYILPNSEVMIHEPLLGNEISGNSSTIKSISDSLLATKQQTCEILVKHTGHTMEEIEEAISYNHYFKAEEAIAFGLADHVISFNDIVTGHFPK